MSGDQPVPTIQWKQFRDYSGPVIGSPGAKPVRPPINGSHVDRAYWLTTKVETGGVPGKVVMYDGTGVTAGLDQHVAVFPRELAVEDYRAENDQGSLWKLIARIGASDAKPNLRRGLDALATEMRTAGWRLSEDGVVRYVSDRTVRLADRDVGVRAGQAVHGAVIRDTITPVGGKVPSEGASWNIACLWGLLFHEITVHPDSVSVQIAYGKEHLVKRTQRRKMEVANSSKSVEEILYGDRGIFGTSLNPTSDPELDLAICVWHSYTVNGPAPAMRALKSVVASCTSTSPVTFAKKLIRAVGDNSYGRWDDDIRHGRYQRTRAHARESGLWPALMFDGPAAIMPADL